MFFKRYIFIWENVALINKPFIKLRKLNKIFEFNFICAGKPFVEIISREIFYVKQFPNIMSKDQDIRNNVSARVCVYQRDASPAARSRNYQTNYPSSIGSTPFKTE